jgi:hypothetical protein
MALISLDLSNGWVDVYGETPSDIGAGSVALHKEDVLAVVGLE